MTDGITALIEDQIEAEHSRPLGGAGASALERLLDRVKETKNGQ